MVNLSNSMGLPGRSLSRRSARAPVSLYNTSDLVAGGSPGFQEIIENGTQASFRLARDGATFGRLSLEGVPLQTYVISGVLSNYTGTNVTGVNVRRIEISDNFNSTTRQLISALGPFSVELPVAFEPTSGAGGFIRIGLLDAHGGADVDNFFIRKA